ncbi:hypothetical protein OEZ86_004278 [Tetradesmus obliquus]|nr:hypothetical protein OEZ86_004278 [Tetradesmus obliquus]
MPQQEAVNGVDGHPEEDIEQESDEAEDQLSSGRDASSGGASARKLQCQALGCTADLAADGRYCIKRRLCKQHLKATSLRRNRSGADGEFRFCQQCGKLEPLSAFEGMKRSCKVQLERRRVGASAARKQRASEQGTSFAAGRHLTNCHMGLQSIPLASAPLPAAAAAAGAAGGAASPGAGAAWLSAVEAAVLSMDVDSFAKILEMLPAGSMMSGKDINSADVALLMESFMQDLQAGMLSQPQQQQQQQQQQGSELAPAAQGLRVADEHRHGGRDIV